MAMLRDSAQKIAVATHNITGYEISITDKDGIIIGCSDKSRVGSSHATSLSVMRRGYEEIAGTQKAEKYHVKPGICLPIKFGNKIIGSVAIAGDVEEVAKYGHLVQKEAEIFLLERSLLESSHLKERAMFNLVQEITTYNPEDMDESILITRGRGVGFDLTLPRVTLIVDIARFNDVVESIQKREGILSQDAEVQIQSVKMDILHKIRGVFNKSQNIISNLSMDKYIIIMVLPSNFDKENVSSELDSLCNRLIQVLRERKLDGSIGIGRIAVAPVEFKESYRSAWRAMGIGKKINRGTGIYNIANFEVEDLLSTLNRNKSSDFVSYTLKNLVRISNWPELRETFMTWCENPFHPGEVARVLNIHRNTLSYRLNKVATIGEIDIHNFNEVFQLYMAIKLRELMDVKVKK